MPTNPIARLTLVVDYDDELPIQEDVNEVVEKARELGTIIKAEL